MAPAKSPSVIIIIIIYERRNTTLQHTTIIMCYVRNHPTTAARNSNRTSPRVQTSWATTLGGRENGGENILNTLARNLMDKRCRCRRYGRNNINNNTSVNTSMPSLYATSTCETRAAGHVTIYFHHSVCTTTRRAF